MERYEQIEKELNKLKYYNLYFTINSNNFGIILDWGVNFDKEKIKEITSISKKILGEQYKNYDYDIDVEDLRKDENNNYEFMYRINFYRRIIK